jgi:hypothetical protein
MGTIAGIEANLVKTSRPPMMTIGGSMSDIVDK